MTPVLKYMTPAVFVIATGKETEVIRLTFEAKGLERDQLAVLMFKLASIVTKQKQHPHRKQATAFISNPPVVPLVMLLDLH